MLVLVPALAAPSASAATSLGDFQLTYYWFAAESGFVGQKVAAPGIAGTYREDFLYSARGVPMEGTGTALQRRARALRRHARRLLGDQGRRARPCPGRNGWSNGSPVLARRRLADRVRRRHVPARRRQLGERHRASTKRPYHDLFGTERRHDVTEWLSIATDLRVIPRGTHVYVPRLAGSPAHGCFRADDTGGAIIGKHIDVFIPQTTLTGLPDLERGADARRPARRARR